MESEEASGLSSDPDAPPEQEPANPYAKRPCKGITAAGEQCRRIVFGENDYCHLHRSQAGRPEILT
jgi:hypothetical protein